MCKIRVHIHLNVRTFKIINDGRSIQARKAVVKLFNLYKPPAVTAVTVLSYVGKHSKINIIKNTSKFVFALLKQTLLYFSNSKRINIVYMFLEMHLKRYAAI